MKLDRGAPARRIGAMSGHADQGAEELFGTETMAELCVRQGRLGDALAIYKRLCARGDGDERLARWSERLRWLEANATSPAKSEAPAEARPAPAAPSVAEAPAPATALVVRETVRSGQIVYAQGRDLLVLAPVNAGAQLMADGHIHVYAPLRGRAVAGVRGNREARIFCQRLDAELVGVDIAYVMADDLPRELRGKPAQVRIEGDSCLVTAL